MKFHARREKSAEDVKNLWHLKQYQESVLNTKVTLPKHAFPEDVLDHETIRFMIAKAVNNYWSRL